jgi:tetratricopeptide (TPR) repeat protein
VTAEIRRDAATAEARYRARVDRHPDEIATIMQLAAFQDRENHNADAVVSYLAALAVDGHLARPNVELCRMYNRLNDVAKAKEYAQKALDAYRATGARNGEGQALFCLADALRAGSNADREQARRYAESATEIFQSIAAPYNLARAYNYQALIAGMQNRRADAALLGEKALAIAKDAGNVVLQPLLLMNLGVTYEALGDRPRAADYYLQSSKLYEALGDQPRAAENQANRGALLIQFSATPEEGLRNVQNALAVARTLGNKTFEVLCLNMIASHYLNVGRHADAERTFNQALAVARERELQDAIFGTTAIHIKHASAKVLIGDYMGARDILSNVLRTSGTTNDDLEAVILMAQVDAHVGDFDAARAGVRRAAPRLESGERALTPLLHLVAGEVEYEAGRYQDARKWFTQAADLWNDDLPDVASVKARAYLGLLDALDGRLQGRRALETSLAHAQKVGRLPLEAFCRVLLARIDIAERKFDDALRMLQPIPPDDAERTIGAELRAQVHYWQMQALTGRGDNAKAQVEVQAARRAIETLRSSLSTSYRTTFTNRPDIRRIVG